MDREDEGVAFSLTLRKQRQGSPHFPLNEVPSIFRLKLTGMEGTLYWERWLNLGR